MSVMVAIQSAEHAQAVIDGLRSRLGRIIKLVADILKLEGLVEVSQGVPFSLQPTCQVQQVKAVGAQGAHGELAEFLGIEKLVGPGDLTVAVVHQTIRGSAGTELFSSRRTLITRVPPRGGGRSPQGWRQPRSNCWGRGPPAS